MRRLLVIGTAHVADPALLAALAVALEAAHPDQLILEMPDACAKAGTLEGQKPEMAFAHRWATERGIEVRGHEPAGPSILRQDLSPERLGELATEMDALVQGLSVRRTIDIFCKSGPPLTDAEARLSSVIDEMIDPDRALVRTEAIIAAVQRLAAPTGVVLVLCGGAHASHLAAQLADCQIIRGDHFF